MSSIWRSRIECIASPTRALWGCWLAAWLTGFGNSGHRSLDFSWTLAHSLVLTSWVLRDMRRLGKVPSYDHSTWLFVTPALLVPVYLFESRGRKAWLAIGAYLGMGMVTGLMAALLTALK